MIFLILLVLILIANRKTKSLNYRVRRKTLIYFAIAISILMTQNFVNYWIYTENIAIRLSIISSLLNYFMSFYMHI